MWKARDTLPVALLLVVLALFGAGITYLMVLRFGAGDIYPPYSSLRADPLGAKVFSESLRHLPGHVMHRHQQDWKKLADGSGATLFVLGLQYPERHDQEMTAGMARFAAGGGRVVLALAPYRSGRPRSGGSGDRDDETETAPDEDGDDESAGAADDDADDEPVRLTETFGFTVNGRNLGTNPWRRPAVRQTEADAALPEELPWPGALFFSGLDPAWRTIYAQGGEPVIVERDWAGGTMVLLADSYLLSNEAMRADRRSALLAWLLGGNRQAVFNEWHLGIREQPGVMSLMRRYRLHGLLAVLLVLAVLFAWQSMVPLVPPAMPAVVAGAPAMVAGHDAATGLVKLLARSIPDHDLLETCVAEWAKTATLDGGGDQATLARVQAVLAAEAQQPPARRDPVAAYHRINVILTERRSAGGN